MTYGCKINVHFRGMSRVRSRMLSKLLVWAVYDFPKFSKEKLARYDKDEMRSTLADTQGYNASLSMLQ